MGRINKANLLKTIYYLKRNGIRRTWYAVLERLEEGKKPPYVWIPPTEAELEAQRSSWKERGFAVSFSILVPVYRTKPEYLRELVDSLRRQTYPGWELILADATEDDSVERILRQDWAAGEVEFWGPEGRSAGETSEEYRHIEEPVPGVPAGAGQKVSGIRYIRLAENAGIAENTNRAIPYAAGDYVGLLDHDDILTENALYEMAAAVQEGADRGIRPQMLYSDEDKCNGDRTEYYEPNRKEDFNLDLLLSNNYICHFLVMKRELIEKLKFRTEYNGAQDYDLVLRAVYALREQESAIVHIPKVLYHWRCHTGSTAENPGSKPYAYESGRRAIQDFVHRAGWRAEAVETAHVGFYALRYQGDLFETRADVGAVGGRIVKKGRILGGRLEEEQVLYENLPIHYSGYLHRAQLSQDASAVDIRNIRVRPECREIFRQTVGVAYETVPGKEIFDVSRLPDNCDIRRASLELGRALRAAGYRILYLPDRAFDLEIRADFRKGKVCTK